MQIIHRFTFVADSIAQATLAGLDLSIAVGLTSVDISEAYSHWEDIAAWMADRRAVDVVRTTFSREEILDASWLAVEPAWHHGYPQPREDAFGYLDATYDLTQYCGECGCGLTQKASFQMRGEPRWGRNTVMQLNWVFDEYFVRSEYFAETLEPLGIVSRPVIDGKGQRLKTTVQLVVSDEVGLCNESLRGAQCPACGRTKYFPYPRGYFPATLSETTGDVVKTKEWFGDGARAYHDVLVSHRVASELLAHDVRGITFRPVESSDASTGIIGPSK